MTTMLKYITEAERARIPESDFAGPNHTFPIDTQAHVYAAAHLYGRAANPQEVRRRIIEIARRRGFALPAGWEKDDTGKSADVLMQFKTVPFELKAASEDGSTFCGYANCFHNIDAAQEIVAPGAFTDTLAEFMSNGFVGGLNHDWNNPIGKPISAKEDGKGLYVEAKISPTQHGRDCMTLVKDKVIQKMSIGYKVMGAMNLEDADACDAYWKSQGYKPTASDIAAAQHGCRVLTKLHLFEFSPVTVPANSMADITSVKRYDPDCHIAYDEIERRLCDVGLARKAAKIWVSGLKALYQRDVEEAKPEEAEEKSEPPQPEAETPPDEQPKPEEKTEDADAEAKQGQDTIEVPAPVVVNVAANLHQSRVQAAYADFEAIKARYGLR